MINHAEVSNSGFLTLQLLRPYHYLTNKPTVLTSELYKAHGTYKKTAYGLEMLSRNLHLHQLSTTHFLTPVALYRWPIVQPEPVQKRLGINRNFDFINQYQESQIRFWMTLSIRRAVETQSLQWESCILWAERCVTSSIQPHNSTTMSNESANWSHSRKDVFLILIPTLSKITILMILGFKMNDM